MALTAAREAREPISIGVARTKFTSGTALLAVAWSIGEDRVLVHYEADKPIRGAHYSQALLYNLGDEDTTLVSHADNGQLGAAGTAGTGAQVVVMDNCCCLGRDCTARDWYAVCNSFNYWCLAAACSGCLWAIFTPG